MTALKQQQLFDEIDILPIDIKTKIAVPLLIFSQLVLVAILPRLGVIHHGSVRVENTVYHLVEIQPFRFSDLECRN